VIDLNGYLVLANERARALLGLTPKDMNRPVRDLDLYTRFSELRTRIQEAYSEARATVITDANWVLEGGEMRIFDIQVMPLRDLVNDSPLGVALTFRDLSPNKRLQDKLEHTHQELETAYEELQSTNEELETTNEELQSTIEELETTNEELQSTNEELETINEEIQSTNEEIQTINGELRTRTAELNQLNDFLESIVSSMRGGVVVVDPDFRVLVWSKTTEDLWGLRSDEVQHKNFLNLDIGLPVDQLRGRIRACLSGESRFEDVELSAVNRRGKPIVCKVTCGPLVNHSSSNIDGVILQMAEIPV
jgi:two-component system, chemotaxis family, CheB/CheR fusion protein